MTQIKMDFQENERQMTGNKITTIVVTIMQQLANNFGWFEISHVRPLLK